VLLATYTAYSFGLHGYIIKKSDHNDKLLSTAFVSFANLVRLSCPASLSYGFSGRKCPVLNRRLLL